MRAEKDESQLVIDACQGSVYAFEALVILYEPRIRRMLYNLTQDVQLTQDLCQESFLAAYRALPRMQGEELRFAPWLYRIVNGDDGSMSTYFHLHRPGAVMMKCTTKWARTT